MLTSLQNEWDKYFPIEENTGDLNLPHFNIEDFTGYNTSQAMDPMSYGATTVGGFTIPSAQDLEDVNFPPTFVPDQPFHQLRPEYQRNRY